MPLAPEAGAPRSSCLWWVTAASLCRVMVQVRTIARCLLNA